MDYFDNFKYINYDFTIKSDKTPIIETIVDTMTRVTFNISDADLMLMCDEYIVPANSKPEQIAYALYNEPLLHWTILYVNKITDINTDWAMSDVSLRKFVTKKYGVGLEYAPHHYERQSDGVIIDPQFCLDTYQETAVLFSNYDYELQLNENKRRIKVVKPAYISAFVEQFNAAMLT